MPPWFVNRQTLIKIPVEEFYIVWMSASILLQVLRILGHLNSFNWLPSKKILIGPEIFNRVILHDYVNITFSRKLNCFVLFSKGGYIVCQYIFSLFAS